MLIQTVPDGLHCAFAQLGIRGATSRRGRALRSDAWVAGRAIRCTAGLVKAWGYSFMAVTIRAGPEVGKTLNGREELLDCRGELMLQRNIARRGALAWLMDRTAEIDAEIDQLIDWLKTFEASVPLAQSVLSRWYRTEIVQSYIRYSWFTPSAAGRAAICLANVTVAEAWRGRGFLALLVDRFAQGADGLQARVLYLDNLASPRFERWLLQIGFQRCPFSGNEFASYYFAPESEEHANSNTSQVVRCPEGRSSQSCSCAIDGHTCVDGSSHGR